ncbi:MAG: Rpn family recombination-promoting nuclease/putative transposase, partial [Planctomycetia bacterium]|nr:Rpn family recombination-promoting nuclease/putative transposase [Planctomycetia bacterium]
MIDLPASNDLVFHAVLGSENSEIILIDLINAVFENDNVPLLKKLTIQNPFHFDEYILTKRAILDVQAQDEKQRKINIEIQTSEHAFFRERILYYWSRLYGSQLNKGDDYTKLKPTTSIVFIKFPIYKNHKEILFDSFHLASKHYSEKILSNHLNIKFIQIPDSFHQKQLGTTNKNLVNWLKFLNFPNGISEEEMDNIINENSNIKKAYDRRFEFLSEEKIQAYLEAEEKRRRDERAIEMEQKNKLLKREQRGLKRALKLG